MADNVVDDPAGGQLAKAAADEERAAVAKPDVERVPAEEVGEDDGHGHGGEDGSEAVLGRVVDGWEDDRGVSGHLDRGEDELARFDGELGVVGPEPHRVHIGLLADVAALGILGDSSLAGADVERFGHAEEDKNKHDSVADRGELEDPAPAEVLADESANYGSYVISVDHGDGVDAHGTTALVKEEEVDHRDSAHGEGDGEEAVEDTGDEELLPGVRVCRAEDGGKGEESGEEVHRSAAIFVGEWDEDPRSYAVDSYADCTEGARQLRNKVIVSEVNLRLVRSIDLANVQLLGYLKYCWIDGGNVDTRNGGQHADLYEYRNLLKVSQCTV